MRGIDWLPAPEGVFHPPILPNAPELPGTATTSFRISAIPPRPAGLGNVIRSAGLAISPSAIRACGVRLHAGSNLGDSARHLPDHLSPYESESRELPF